MPDGVYRKACKSKKKFVKKFGDDSSADYPVQLSENAHIGQELGVVDVLLGDAAAPGAPKEKAGFDKEKGISWEISAWGSDITASPWQSHPRHTPWGPHPTGWT